MVSVPTDRERWHCPDHRHLAQPGDLLKHEEPYVGLSTTGAPIKSTREKARLEAWHREHREEEERERRLREEHARRQGEALDAVRQRYGEEAEIRVAGVVVHPKDVTFS